MSVSNDERRFFDEVYNDSFSLLFRVVRRITVDEDAAEEVCHEAFIRFHDHMDRIPDAQQARYWLLRVGKNLAFNYAKRRTREQRANQRVFNEPARAPDEADEHLLREDTARLVRQAIDRLPQKLRDVVVLKEYGELSYVEIGKTLNISVSNVKVRVHRARERLARELEALGVIGA